MATNPVPRKWTVEEYLAYEQETDIRHEYIDGEIYAMSGGTKKHAVIGAHCTRVIGNQVLDSDCYVTNSEMRVQISQTKYVYPDFVAVCGQDEFTDDNEVTLINPTVVGEVVSDSSEKYDIGLKSQFYRSLPSLQHYVIIYQHKLLVQVYTRNNDEWRFKEFNKLDAVVSLDAIGVKLPLREIYRDIEFDDNS